MIDAIEDEVLDRRARPMANDAAMMALVAESRRANDHQPEQHRLDLEATFRAVPGSAGR